MTPSSMKIEILDNMEKDNNEKDNMEKILERFTNITNVLNQYKSDIATIINEVKTLEKITTKELKSMRKDIDKRKINKKPSGFATPTRISNELCDFMNIDQGSKRARTEVTQYLINYINENELQNNDNKKVINLDNKLKNLLNVDEKEQINYFNIQKYMNKHFTKQ